MGIRASHVGTASGDVSSGALPRSTGAKKNDERDLIKRSPSSAYKLGTTTTSSVATALDRKALVLYMERNHASRVRVCR